MIAASDMISESSQQNKLKAFLKKKLHKHYIRNYIRMNFKTIIQMIDKS